MAGGRDATKTEDGTDDGRQHLAVLKRRDGGQHIVKRQEGRWQKIEWKMANLEGHYNGTGNSIFF